MLLFILFSTYLRTTFSETASAPKVKAGEDLLQSIKEINWEEFNWETEINSKFEFDTYPTFIHYLLKNGPNIINIGGGPSLISLLHKLKESHESNLRKLLLTDELALRLNPLIRKINPWDHEIIIQQAKLITFLESLLPTALPAKNESASLAPGSGARRTDQSGDEKAASSLAVSIGTYAEPDATKSGKPQSSQPGWFRQYFSSNPGRVVLGILFGLGLASIFAIPPLAAIVLPAIGLKSLLFSGTAVLTILSIAAEALIAALVGFLSIQCLFGLGDFFQVGKHLRNFFTFLQKNGSGIVYWTLVGLMVAVLSVTGVALGLIIVAALVASMPVLAIPFVVALGFGITFIGLSLAGIALGLLGLIGYPVAKAIEALNNGQPKWQWLRTGLQWLLAPFVFPFFLASEIGNSLYEASKSLFQSLAKLVVKMIVLFSLRTITFGIPMTAAPAALEIARKERESYFVRTTELTRRLNEFNIPMRMAGILLDAVNTDLDYWTLSSAREQEGNRGVINEFFRAGGFPTCYGEASSLLPRSSLDIVSDTHPASPIAHHRNPIGTDRVVAATDENNTHLAERTAMSNSGGDDRSSNMFGQRSLLPN